MSARRVIAVLAVLFFALPLGLRFFGMTVKSFENRPLAPAPSLAAGWDVFDETTRYFVDRMPLRKAAVRSYGWTSLNVLGTSPTWRRERADLAGLGTAAATAAAAQPAERRAAVPARDRIVVGTDGWLFLRDELVSACRPLTPWPVVLARSERLAAAIRASSRPAVVFMAPSKTAIYGEHLTRADRDELACAERRWNAAEPLMARAGPSVIWPRRTLLAAKRTSSEHLYQRKDTHWNTYGASVVLPAIVARLGGEVRVRPQEIVAGPPRRYQGDLTNLRGVPETDTTPTRLVRRRPGAEKLPGRTLVIGDSFVPYLADVLRPYAEELRVIEWPATPVEQLKLEIEAARRVVIEIADREVASLFGDSKTALFTRLLTAAERDGLRAGGG